MLVQSAWVGFDVLSVRVGQNFRIQVGPQSSSKYKVGPRLHSYQNEEFIEMLVSTPQIAPMRKTIVEDKSNLQLSWWLHVKELF